MGTKQQQFSWASLDHFDWDCVAFCVGLSALFFAEFCVSHPFNWCEPIVTSCYAIWKSFQPDCRLVWPVWNSWQPYQVWPQVGLLISRDCWHLAGSLPTALNGTSFDPAAGTYVDLSPILVMVPGHSLGPYECKAVLRFDSRWSYSSSQRSTLFILCRGFSPKPWQLGKLYSYGLAKFMVVKQGYGWRLAYMFFAFLGFEPFQWRLVDEIINHKRTFLVYIIPGLFWSVKRFFISWLPWFWPMAWFLLRT